MKEGIKWDDKTKRMVVSGELSFATVMGLQAAGDAVLMRQRQCEVDLAQVTQCDTCSIILLIAWLRLANERGISLSFKNVSSQIKHLASVHGVTELLF
jgi:ABC-type transporter Mla MlaB component